MQQLIAAIHDSARRVVACVTGGGAQAIADLLAPPGASRTLIEAAVPYSLSALHEWLGGATDQACSEPTARAMAMASWLRAARLEPNCDVESLVGVSCTASLATDRPKRGAHRIYVASQTSRVTKSLSLTLAKGARRRDEEQHLAAAMLLIALGEACQCDVDVAQQALAAALRSGEAVLVCQQAGRPGWAELLTGGRPAILPGESDGRAGAGLPDLLFPGAFHPPHRGHLRMAQIAEAKLGRQLGWEISLRNVDKPPLDWIAVEERIVGLRTVDLRRTIVLSCDATFDRKAMRWPGVTFVVGADTLARIADPSYYANDPAARDRTLACINNQGCRFLVFGRVVDGEFSALGDLELPGALLALCVEVPAAEFREDVSSTQLRS